MDIPKAAADIIGRLNASGYEAYAVGGCVRDSMRGVPPSDWDLTTSATPQEVIRLFSEEKVLETGLQHGTVTLVTDHTPYEITTFRVDGAYTDHRRPETVHFTRSIREDLARRDFTINAMAYHPETGLVDPFGGERDLAQRRIVCVGDPSRRFQEDALRILRAVRFASALDFRIEAETASAMEAAAHTLAHIAPERIQAELSKALVGSAVATVFRSHQDIIFQILPELRPMVGFDQQSRYHHLDLWEHTLLALELAAPDPLIRLVMLLHDIGKPACFFRDDTGGHFKGHGEAGAKLAASICRRLRFSGDTCARVERLIRYHDSILSLPAQTKTVKRWLSRVGEESAPLLFEISRADTLAHAPWCVEQNLERLADFQRLTDQMIREGQCVSLAQLAVDGNDLMALGVEKGPLIGKTLHHLLDRVIDDAVPNSRERLLAEVEDFRRNQGVL